MRQYFSLIAEAALKHSKSSHSDHQSVEHPGDFENSDVLQKLASAGCDLVSLHQRTGEVLDCSVSQQDFNGLGPDDLRDAGFIQRVHVVDRPAFLGALSVACHSGEQARVELRLSCRSEGGDGDYFCWVEITCTSMTTAEDGQINTASEAPVMCVTRDISHFKQREQELIELQRATQETLDLKTRHLSNMSHELRTPLNAIIGFSEMMKLPGITAQSEQQMVEYAGFINDSGRHLLGVVDEVFELSQFANGQYKRAAKIFGLGDLVSASMELVLLEAEEKEVRLVVADYDEDLEISADWQVCKQVLVALLVGAIKASSVADRVYLTIKPRPGFVEFLITGSASDPQIVSDTDGFWSGSQMRGFVDLLAGELLVGTNAHEAHEVSLCLPDGLSTGAGDSNIVSLESGQGSVLPDLQKTA